MSGPPTISIIVCAHNPDAGRLRRALAGLREQALPAVEWETILVDNASTRFPDAAFFAEHAPKKFSVVKEAALGLTAARKRGFETARGEFAVLVDDDNVLAPDYLSQVLSLFAAYPRMGAMGGKVLPEFEIEPPPWTREFFPLLALRDLGNAPLVSQGLRPPGAIQNQYPLCAPIGAGMALRRDAWTAWLKADTHHSFSDRRGSELTSSGDNDIVLSVLDGGWEVAYFPQLMLTHLIASSRLDRRHLARLNRAIQISWMQVLSLHNANAWPPLTAFSACLRKIKAWITLQAWSSPAAHIRWRGACGHFDGRVARESRASVTLR